MFLDDFRVRQARALGINNFFGIVYLRTGDVAKTGNIHVFREMPMDSYSGEHEKHIFDFFLF